MSKRILVLDDHQAILEVVTEALAYEQFEVLDISYLCIIINQQD
jgi:DNA-binding response OmpR family regulator